MKKRFYPLRAISLPVILVVAMLVWHFKNLVGATMGFWAAERFAGSK